MDSEESLLANNDIKEETKEMNENISINDKKRIDNKDISNQSEQILFKVVPEEKEPRQPNLFIYNSDKKSMKKSNKQINIIKPKFVTRTMQTFNIKPKIMEDQPQTLSLSLNLTNSASAFQPQILKDKEFKVKIKDKLYNLFLDITQDNKLYFKLNEISENIYAMKYYYEEEFSMENLKKLNKFFKLFDYASEAIIELEKNLMKKNYNVVEDIENKVAKIEIKVMLLESEENIEFILPQKIYSKDNLFENLCKKVEMMSNDYNQKISKLEEINSFLMRNLYTLSNRINPMNVNYQLNRDNNINKMNGTFKKTISIVKRVNDENRQDNEIIEEDEQSNEMSKSEILDQSKDKNEFKALNKKRNRRKISLNSKSNCTNNNSNNNDIINNGDYYLLKDLKLNKNLVCKGLYKIFKSNDEIYMVLNKILYKLSKNKKNYNLPNYENKLQFNVQLLFDSSHHGDSAAEFHNKCDYKNNTITLIETDFGHRFGGYAFECFESPEKYFDKKDNLSFVFSLDKMKIYDVIKGKYAISCDKNYGPYFRDDHICIVDKFFTKESGTCIKGKVYNTTKNYELNSGKKYFYIKRLQVFHVKIKIINK